MAPTGSTDATVIEVRRYKDRCLMDPAGCRALHGGVVMVVPIASSLLAVSKTGQLERRS